MVRCVKMLPTINQMCNASGSQQQDLVLLTPARPPTGWKYEPNKLCSCSKAKKLGKCADLVWACHSGLKYEHRLRSPCLTDRPLFVTWPGKGDNHLAPVLKRANWIMHHGGKVLQDEAISEDIFTSIPITATYMSATWSGSVRAISSPLWLVPNP